jgi:hypothetical protein
MNRQRETEIADLQKVMSLPQGRRLIWRILSSAGIFSPCYSPESEGARRGGLALLGEIMSDTPSEYLVMQQEAMAAEKKRKEEQQPQKENDPLSGEQS